MFNRVIIVGNLTRDIELRYLPSGTAVGGCGIASTRKFKGGDGSQKEEVLFVDITFFGRTAEIANQYLKKGSKILVEGRLKLDSWTDQNGGKRSKHSVVVENMTMLDSRGDSNNNYQASSTNSNQNFNRADVSNNMEQKSDSNFSSNNNENNIPSIDIDDDEVPF